MGFRYLGLLLGLASCGVFGGGIGGPCAVETDCASGLTCYVRGDFEGGLCSRPCDVNTPCPAGSVCVVQAAKAYLWTSELKLCGPPCATDSDCRYRYECSRNSPTEQLGCRYE